MTLELVDPRVAVADEPRVGGKKGGNTGGNGGDISSDQYTTNIY